MNARTRGRWGRLTVLVALVSLALAACARPSRPGSGPPAAEAETTAPATRTVGHALGTAAIPTDRRRIVVLNQYLPLDALVALGVQPFGSTGDPTWSGGRRRPNNSSWPTTNNSGTSAPGLPRFQTRSMCR